MLRHAANTREVGFARLRIDHERTDAPPPAGGSRHRAARAHRTSSREDAHTSVRTFEFLGARRAPNHRARRGVEDAGAAPAQDRPVARQPLIQHIPNPGYKCGPERPRRAPTDRPATQTITYPGPATIHGAEPVRANVSARAVACACSGYRIVRRHGAATARTFRRRHSSLRRGESLDDRLPARRRSKPPGHAARSSARLAAPRRTGSVGAVMKAGRSVRRSAGTMVRSSPGVSQGRPPVARSLPTPRRRFEEMARHRSQRQRPAARRSTRRNIGCRRLGAHLARARRCPPPSHVLAARPAPRSPPPHSPCPPWRLPLCRAPTCDAQCNPVRRGVVAPREHMSGDRGGDLTMGRPAHGPRRRGRDGAIAGRARARGIDYDSHATRLLSHPARRRLTIGHDGHDARSVTPDDRARAAPWATARGKFPAPANGSVTAIAAAIVAGPPPCTRPFAVTSQSRSVAFACAVRTPGDRLQIGEHRLASDDDGGAERVIQHDRDRRRAHDQHRRPSPVRDSPAAQPPARCTARPAPGSTLEACSAA